eukprot:TRINITY_DN7236_c0_g1_i1.p2 TRINITY_DN7236_c0_g1~~TRINITY_DN7236_c0_g1_i1.p2  ORF type:complete len:112 (+),score=10.05 TRINITY_DN7236_c0_g1_i1:23-337(+)
MASSGRAASPIFTRTTTSQWGQKSNNNDSKPSSAGPRYNRPNALSQERKQPPSQAPPTPSFAKAKTGSSPSSVSPSPGYHKSANVTSDAKAPSSKIRRPLSSLR